MDLDPIAAVRASDPYPYYDELVRRRGLHFDPRLQLWIAADAATVVEVFAHPAARVRPIEQPVPSAFAETGAGELFGSLVRFNDGEERHAVPKRAIAAALSGVPASAVQTAAAAASLRSRLATAEDLNAWMFAVPVAAVASLLGVATGDLSLCEAQLASYLAAIAPGAAEGQRAAGSTAARALIDRFAPMRERSPAQVCGALAREAEAEGWIDARRIAANLAGLLVQTYDATAGLIGNALVRIQRTAGLEHTAGAQQRELEALVAQTMREDPPVHNTRRFVSEDAKIAGLDLPAGSQILLVLASAGRDPAAPAGGFGFGFGAHVCPGSKIAQSVSASALQGFLQYGGRAWMRDLTWSYRAYPNIRSPHFALGADA